MTDTPNSIHTNTSVPHATVHSKKSFSIIWVVPVVAAVIGGWLAYKAATEKGPVIRITFETAQGLEAGKTKIKYKDVEVGHVTAIQLGENLSNVVVTAELVKQAEDWLTENSRFWVVRARVAAGSISGLGTVFSGAFIGMDPGTGEKSPREFKGLEIPPVVTADLAGSHFQLRSDRLGSLDIGAPVYFRQIRVGKVAAYGLEAEGQSVGIDVFIAEPYHTLVSKDTRFWNASGLDISVDTSGIKVDTESFVSMMVGGIGFETPVSLNGTGPVPGGHKFALYPNRQSIYEKSYEEKNKWILHFDTSVRGLAVGAPVEFRGTKIGQVLDVRLEFDMADMSFRTPVLIDIEPGRIAVIGEQPKDWDREDLMNHLVTKGFRAQIASGSLLTGQMFVALDVFPNEKPREIIWTGQYPELPTIASAVDKFKGGVTQLAERLGNLPIEEIANNLQSALRGADRLLSAPEIPKAIQSLSDTLEHIRKITTKLDTQVTPAFSDTLEQTRVTLAEAQHLLSTDSPLHHQLNRMMVEFADAARSIRALADYLEKNPEALLRGKN